MTRFVGVAGTHSTGKSTFVKLVGQRLQEKGALVAVVSDLAEACCDAGFGILREHTFESTLWIMTTGIARELEAGLRAKYVIVDRPVPDALGYLLAAIELRGAQLREADCKYLSSLAQHHSRRYHVLVKTILDDSIPLAGSRDPDLVFRQLAAVKIDAVFRDLRLPFVPLSYGGAAVVCDQVLAELEEGS